MDYDRKIIYLNRYRNGEKISSAGFLRVQIHGDYVDMQAMVHSVDGDGTELNQVTDLVVHLENGDDIQASLKQIEKTEEVKITEINEEEVEDTSLPGEKWQQLWKVYPHVRPFEDEREYLSIGPQDFVILSESTYAKAHNSFLLHGYYTYRHLILKSIHYNGTRRYYLGVPGLFLDREKQVAVLYGFESFEGKHEPAQNGDQGYYLIRVEL